jgi:hypothetical protein
MKKNEKLDNNYQNSCSISLFEICTFLTLLLNSIELGVLDTTLCDKVCQ